MAVYEIKNKAGVTEQVFRVLLGDTFFKMRLKYNARSESWTIDLMDSDGTPKILGQRIVGKWNPFRDILVEALPFGRIVVINRNDIDSIPGENDLGPGKASGIMYVSGV